MEETKIIARLKDFGYVYDTINDLHFLQFEMEKTRWHIFSAINYSELPEGLTHIAIDMVCASFLKVKKGFGQLTEIQFENIAKSIAMGDTNVTFADGMSPEQKFDVAIEALLNGYEEDFFRHRRMVW